MYEKVKHGFVEEQTEKPVEIVIERKDENGKLTYDVGAHFQDLSNKMGLLLVFGKFSHSLVCGLSRVFHIYKVPGKGKLLKNLEPILLKYLICKLRKIL